MLDVAKIDATFRQFTDDNLPQSSQLGGVFGSQRDFVFVRENFSRCALEIKASGKLFARLIQGIIKLLPVHFGDNIERGHLRLF